MAIQSVGSFGNALNLPAAPQGSGAPPVVQAATAEAPKVQAPPQAPAVSREDIEQAIEQIKTKVEPVVSNALQFSVDDSTGKTVVKIVDGQTGKMIRQIPSEELLAIAESIDRMQGLLLRQKA